MPWILFVVFEVLAYFGLRVIFGGLGATDQWTPNNTISLNWAVAVWFILGHVALTVAAYLMLSQRLAQKYRGRVLPWFWRSLLAMVVEVFVLLG
ncbi:MAG: hypothetical protein H7330_15350 [Hymenobacteraceae bacterium]|nr:hypothetical protein [Hymenobacteraceae bacterium]